MLIDVCKEALLPLSRPDRYTQKRLIQEARECHLFQTLLSEGFEIDDLDVLADTIDSDDTYSDYASYSDDAFFSSNHKRRNIYIMIDMLQISDDERIDLRDYIIDILDSEDNSERSKPVETNQPETNSIFNKLYGFILAIIILFGPFLVYDIWMNTAIDYSPLLDKYEMLHEMASSIITNTLESLRIICSVPLEIVEFLIGLIRKRYELYQETRITKTIYVKSSSIGKVIGRRRRKKKELICRSGIEDIQIDTATGSHIPVDVTGILPSGSYVEVHVTGRRQSVQKAIELIQEVVGLESMVIFTCMEIRILSATTSNATQAQLGQDEGMLVESEPISDSNTLEEQHVTHNDSSDIKPMQEEEDSLTSEIGVDDSSQEMSHYTITESCALSLDDKSSGSTSKAHSTFELNENDPLLVFLRSQHQCIKGSVDEFYTWLVNSEDIDSMMALKEAVSDDDYLNNKMKRGCGGSGLKGFKLSTFKRVVLEYEDTTTDDDLSKAPAASKHEPPEELVCPISLVLMTKDPVVAADGITYERASIEDWFEKSKAKISEAREKFTNNQQSESDQRVVDTGICSPVYGSKLENLILVSNISLRNVARTYKE